MHNNLGGKGPDNSEPQSLQFLRVATIDNQCLEMDVQVATGSDYNPMSAFENGMAQVSPNVGEISLQAQSRSDLTLRFLDCDTHLPVKLSKFNLTFYALSTPSQRQVTVRGYWAYFLTKPEYFQKTYTDYGTTFIDAAPCIAPIGDQECALSYFFQDASQVSFTLQTVAGGGQRFFLGAAVCPPQPLPPGTCAQSRCGPGLRLKGQAPASCAGQVCTQDECCERDPRICTAPVCGPGFVLKDSTERPPSCSGEACTQDQCCNEVKQPMPTPFPAVVSCRGQEREWLACDNLPECNPCVPQDCQFSDWSEWEAVGGCSGLCKRRRNTTLNNECGAPCSGHLEETDARHEDALCYPEHCRVQKVDCQWSEWAEWTQCQQGCSACMRGQSYRERRMEVKALAGGQACQGSWNMTRPCQMTDALDCKMTDWGGWTSCSKTCGTGWKFRMRRVLQEAKWGGKPCGAEGDYGEGLATRQTHACNVEPCGTPQPCVLDTWAEWYGCNADSPNQKFRSREILMPALNGAERCNHPLNETMGCPATPVVQRPCDFSLWGEWAECSASCQGQTFRTRHLLNAATCVLDGARHGQSLRETQPCGAQLCWQETCDLSPWTAWSRCSAECGKGVATRSRQVVAVRGGGGCTAGLAEVQACQIHKCEPVDCKWGDWGNWDPCTNTCGGGTTRRSRMVKVAPRNGGKGCDPEAKAEVAQCATQSCDACVDGRWGQWTEWSVCSASCSPAFRSRHRDLERHANHCGKPAVGPEDEYGLCNALAPCVADVDCQVSEWGNWSDCSSTCFGVRERARQIATFASGGGKKCVDTSLKEVEPCYPASGESAPEACGAKPEQVCRVGDWEDWGACSRKCGGGQTSRARHILSPAANGGELCNETLVEIAPCGERPCGKDECQDCLWAQWSSWGTCTRCGSQRFRHRSIESLPNHCGKPCEQGSAKEAGTCRSECQEMSVCAWTDWKDSSQCSSQCGAATRSRTRHLFVSDKDLGNRTFFVTSDANQCRGSQADVVNCSLPACKSSCQLVDCEFRAWSEWGNCTCGQLRERKRSIKTVSACGGKPCEGSMVETERCTKVCQEAVDCKFGDWAEWTPKFCADKGEQRSRVRQVVQQAEGGGRPCEGVTSETAPCLDGTTAPKNCELAAWQPWSQCTAQCGGGLQTRFRVIRSLAAPGGEPCVGTLEEIERCNEANCTSESKDCQLSPWAAWSSCEGLTMRFRIRTIQQQPLGAGTACFGALKEAEECSAAVDCMVSEWTGWDECDKTCGGGQRTRAREVTRNPSNGGKPCPDKLVETAGCNEQVCDAQDCVVSDWSSWASCSVTCGMGFITRNRTYTARPCEDGRGCNDNLEEVEPCVAAPCSCNDCVWGDWEEWAACTSPCNGGQRTRERHIAKQPDAGCKPCDARSKEEVEACNTQRCDAKECIDGKWADWQDWEECSASCAGGVTWRSRAIQVEANECGMPAVGLSSEHIFCNVGVPCDASVDCEFEDWGDWSTCSTRCEGLKHRTRGIKTRGSGDGGFCEGSTEENAPCEVASGVEDWQEASMYLDLNHVASNNLGFAGPGTSTEPTLHFSHAATLEDGKFVDLVVSPKGTYTGCDMGTNGVHGHIFGSVNVAAGSRVTLDFRLVDSTSKADVVVKDWNIKIFDLDTGAAGTSKESVHAKGFQGYTLAPVTAVQVEEEFSDLTKFEGTRYGTADDDPDDPTQVTASQEAKTLVLHYKDTAAVELTFEVTSGAVCKTFLFASRACFAENCTASPCKKQLYPAVDCLLTDWSPWDPCDSTCGVGQHARSRRVIAEPAYGGRTCSDALSQTERCEEKPCDVCTPIDCSWEDWHDWGACDRCGGQMRRFRHIAAHAACGGQACVPGDAEQITNCTRNCQDRTSCQWADWGAFGDCSATCGNGLRSRVRYLKAVPTEASPGTRAVFKKRLLMDGEELPDPSSPDLPERLEQLRRRGARLRAARLRVLAFAFLAGLLSLAAGVAVVKRGLCRRGGRLDPSRSDPLTQVAIDSLVLGYVPAPMGAGGFLEA